MEAEPLTVSPHIVALVRRMAGGSLKLLRTSSQAPEAVERGGGYLYSTHPDGRSVGPKLGRFLIDAGFVVSRGDDLFSATLGGGAAFCARRPSPGLPGA